MINCRKIGALVASTALLSLAAAASMSAPVSAALPPNTNLHGDGTFSATADPYVYDTKVVPAGANGSVTSWSKEENKYTLTLLTVEGMLPSHKYDAFLTDKPCGAKPTDAGGHFQYEQDPVQPSKDPKYANAENEVWLAFTADAKGATHSHSHNKWLYGDRLPQSAVILDGAKADPNAAAVPAACITLKQVTEDPAPPEDPAPGEPAPGEPAPGEPTPVTGNPPPLPAPVPDPARR